MLRALQLAIAIVVLLQSSASATTGSPEVIAHEVRLPEARKDPAPVIAEFRQVEPDKDRFVAFMLLMTLGREERITPEQFQMVTHEGLIDIDPRIRAYSVHFIHDVNDDDEFQKLCRCSTLDKYTGVRYNAAEQLRDWPSAESLRYLEALLGDESLSVRHRASGTLQRWHSVHKFPDIRDVFDRAVQSDDLRRSGCAAAVLAFFFHAPPRTQILNNYLAQEIESRNADADIVRWIIRLLGTIGDPSSQQVLELATKHPNRYVVATAQEALAQLAAPAAQ